MVGGNFGELGVACSDLVRNLQQTHLKQERNESINRVSILSTLLPGSCTAITISSPLRVRSLRIAEIVPLNHLLKSPTSLSQHRMMRWHLPKSPLVLSLRQCQMMIHLTQKLLTRPCQNRMHEPLRDSALKAIKTVRPRQRLRKRSNIINHCVGN